MMCAWERGRHGVRGTGVGRGKHALLMCKNICRGEPRSSLFQDEEQAEGAKACRYSWPTPLLPVGGAAGTAWVELRVLLPRCVFLLSRLFLSVCLSVCLSACLSVCLSVCLSGLARTL